MADGGVLCSGLRGKSRELELESARARTERDGALNAAAALRVQLTERDTQYAMLQQVAALPASLPLSLGGWLCRSHCRSNLCTAELQSDGN